MKAKDRSAQGDRASLHDEKGGPRTWPSIICPGWPAGTDGSLPDPLGLSHELRTPLTTILGSLELMLEGSTGPLSGTARACLSDIQAAARRLEHRVEDVLLLVDIAKRADLGTREPVDLVDLLCGAAAAASGSGAPDIEVEVAPQALPLIVAGDRLLLQRMSRIIVGLARGSIAMAVEPVPASARTMTLRLGAPPFDASLVPPIDVALLAHILRLHAASGAWKPEGMRVQWPETAG